MAVRKPSVVLVVGSVLKDPRGLVLISEANVETKLGNVCVVVKLMVELMPSNIEKTLPGLGPS